MTNPTDLYKEAGVDTTKGDALADWLAQDPVRSANGTVLSGIGGFAGLFAPNLKGYAEPILVACTDGVGTKVLLAANENKVDGLGDDLVAMCVNDLYTIGATPLFFLDYFATGALDDQLFQRVLTSIKRACRQCGAALLGGETAEMPGLYQRGHFDLAGFVVGIVDKKAILGPERVKAGDVLVALPSSGLHSNGFSLVRKWMEHKSVEQSPRNSQLIDRLLAPTKIYSEIPELAKTFGADLHAFANITGGGISGNLPRVLPNGTAAKIDFAKLPTQGWLREYIQSNGASLRDVEPVFNLGVGMIAVVCKDALPAFMKAASALGPVTIGEVIEFSGTSEPHVIYG